MKVRAMSAQQALVPETKGRSLEEIEASLQRKAGGRGPRAAPTAGVSAR